MEILKNCPICGFEKLELYLSGKDYFLTGEGFNIVQCSRCGLAFTNPRPSSSEMGKYYKSTEYISHSDKRKGLFAIIYQTIRKYTLWRKSLLINKYQTTGNILDIGCATGQFLHYMKQLGWDVTGIEPDKTAREKASSEFGLNVYAEEKLDSMEDSTFDVITLWHVMEHIPGLAEKMNQIRKLLKPDGILIIAVPNPEAADAKYYKNYWAGYDLPRHLYHFRKQDITMLCQQNGFKVSAMKPMKFDAYYVSMLSEKYRKGKIQWITAIFRGLHSNLMAIRDTNYSSLIYVAKKS